MGIFRFRKDDIAICEKTLEANHNTSRKLPNLSAKEQRVIATARVRGSALHRDSN